jgi:hypothetical protein
MLAAHQVRSDASLGDAVGARLEVGDACGDHLLDVVAQSIDAFEQLGQFLGLVLHLGERIERRRGRCGLGAKPRHGQPPVYLRGDLLVTDLVIEPPENLASLVFDVGPE